MASVRSRVVNLSELSDEINVYGMVAALKSAFGEVYGLCVRDGILPSEDALASIRTEFASDEWKYNRTPAFSHKLTARFAWGGITLELDVREGVVAESRVYSDALDSEYISTLADKIKGCRYDAAQLCLAVGDDRTEARDVAELFKREI